MDYIFRWLQLRFLTGQQQALFDGLRPKYVNAPAPGTPDEAGQKSFGDFTGARSGLVTDNRQPTTDNRATNAFHASRRAEGPDRPRRRTHAATSAERS